ncbi:hypothetical protein BLNAU_1531 [Blattamonas nauphoetae]|uniref:RRM domain-containing protein n=1 Tax=Blattamonas nauphoetae TaxID=2049346 RepID=A0ABQ9YID7_9EUKA|nr:hypothetical protein BLNAU_1531 [Blattamonas nauphoetae]
MFGQTQFIDKEDVQGSSQVQSSRSLIWNGGAALYRILSQNESLKHQNSQNCKICVKNIRPPSTVDAVERFFRELCGSEMTEFQRGKRKAGQTVHSVQIVFRTPETAKRFLERPYLIVNSQIVSVLPPTFNKTVQIGIPSTHSGVSRSDLKNEVMEKIGNEHPLQSDIEFDKDNTTMFLSFETRKGAEAARKELCTQGVFGGVGNVRWLEEESRRFGSEVVAKFRLPREWFLSGEELSRSAPTREDLENRLLLFEEVHGRLEKVFMDMFFGWVSRKEARPENKPTFEVHVGEKNWLSGAVHVGFKRTPKGEEDARRCVSFFSENSRSRVVKITYRGISKELHLSVQIHTPQDSPSSSVKHFIPEKKPLDCESHICPVNTQPLLCIPTPNSPPRLAMPEPSRFHRMSVICVLKRQPQMVGQYLEQAPCSFTNHYSQRKSRKESGSRKACPIEGEAFDQTCGSDFHGIGGGFVPKAGQMWKSGKEFKPKWTNKVCNQVGQTAAIRVNQSTREARLFVDDEEQPGVLPSPVREPSDEIKRQDFSLRFSPHFY